MDELCVLIVLRHFLRTLGGTCLEKLASKVHAIAVACRIGHTSIARFSQVRGRTQTLIKRSSRYFIKGCPSIDLLASALTHLIVGAGTSRIILATDWTELGKYRALVTVLLTKSRSIPIFWTVVPWATGMIETETSHFKALSALLPVGIEYVILADRGFGNVRVIRTLRSTPLKFVLRTKAVSIRRPGTSSYSRLREIGCPRSVLQDFGQVEFTIRNPVTIRLVRFHDVGQRAPWILVTDLKAPAITIVRLYGRRFQIEQTFRDLKDTRYGMHLGGYTMGHSTRLQGMIGAGVFAYLMLTLIGLHAQKRLWDKDYQSNKRAGELATWRIGWFVMTDERRGRLITPDQMIAQVSNLALKTGHWDWQERPYAAVSEWTTSIENADIKDPEQPRWFFSPPEERPCDLLIRVQLREELKARGWKQQQLADLLNRSPSNTNMVLMGRNALPPGCLDQAAAFLNMSTAQLVESTGWTPKNGNLASKRHRVLDCHAGGPGLNGTAIDLFV